MSSECLGGVLLALGGQGLPKFDLCSPHHIITVTYKGGCNDDRVFYTIRWILALSHLGINAISPRH